MIATTVHDPADRSLIVHVPAAGDALPAVGEAVTAQIDWEPRHARMRIHTALHLLSVVLSYPVTGGSIGNGDGRLDFDIPEGGLDKADIEAYRAFLLTWMRTHRLKHTSDSGRLSSHGTVLGTRFVAELAPDKEALRAGRTQRLELLRCDTTRLGDALGSATVDALVADLPYGVQHGARTGGALARSPLATLAEALPVWRGLLRRDGGMALALNRRTAPFDDAARTLEAAGFVVVSADGEFRHRVDQSIDRDVLVAVRTDHPRADLLRAGSVGAVAPSEERNRS